MFSLDLGKNIEISIGIASGVDAVVLLAEEFIKI
jgi:hypothetical protein